MCWARRTCLLLLLATTLSACARPTIPPGDVTKTPAPVERAPDPVFPPAKAGPTAIQVAYRYGEGWRPLSPLASHVSPGGAEVRITFSKPVPPVDVERALQENQPGLVRGLMQWQDDRTLFWQIAQLPPRLDFLFGTSTDAEGVPLPGGVPSLRVGEPPTLVEVDLGGQSERTLAMLPPDLVTASRTPDGKSLNILAWIPGSTRWDWQTREFNLELSSGALQPGRVEAVQPRIPDDLEGWVLSPNGTLVAGLKTEQRTPPDANPYQADLMLLDLRAGRRATYEQFLSRYMGTTYIDLSTYLAWSPDGALVAGLSYTNPESKESSDLVALNVATGAKTVLAKSIPVSAFGARLAWSPNRRFMLAGNLLLDLEAQRHRALPGGRSARGVWEPDGDLLLYSTEDWGPIFVVDAETGVATPLGEGLLVDWAASGKAYIVRWPASATRFQPPGM